MSIAIPGKLLRGSAPRRSNLATMSPGVEDGMSHQINDATGQPSPASVASIRSSAFASEKRVTSTASRYGLGFVS